MLLQRKWKIIACLWLGLCPVASHALLYPLPLPADYAQVSLTGNYYLLDSNQKDLSDVFRSNIALGAAGRISTANSWLGAVAEGEGALGLTKKQSTYVNAREAYLTAKVASFLRVSAGRKLLRWSQLEETWDLGLFQPRFRWDYLDARTNGLVGVFAHFGEDDQWALDVYGSPIFLPDQGAPFEIADGACTTSSPWFKCPSSTISLFNKPTNIKLNLEIPPILKIISYAGAGGTLRIGSEKNGPWGRASYTYKPINQFLLAYEGFLSTAGTVPQLPATIRPRVLRHELAGADLGYRREGEYEISASAINERVIRDTTPTTWNTQEIGHALAYGAHAQARLFGRGPASTVASLSYFHRNGGNASDRGPFASSGETVFEPRYAFEDAWGFLVRTPIIAEWSERFYNQTRFVWETIHDGNLLTSDFFYRPGPRWLVNLGFDLIGTNNVSAIEFFARYQRNDRVRGGVSYAF